MLDIDEPMNNWNKWLVVLQCVTAPLFISLATECECVEPGYLLVMINASCASILLLIILNYFTS